MLSSVVGVDADVFMGEVGGPELAGSIALVEIDADRKLRLLDVGMRGVLVVPRGPARHYGRWQLAERYVDGLWIDLLRRSSRWQP